MSDFSEAITWTPEAGVRLERTPARRLGPMEVAVKMDFAGVCGTDIDIVRGVRSDRPGILGHEGTGVIEESGHPLFPAGTRVVFRPVSSTNQDVVLGHTTEGIWQSRRIFSENEIAAGHLHTCHLDVRPELAPLAEPISTAIYALSIVSTFVQLRKIAVIGAGKIGLQIAIEAKRRGVEEIHVISVSRSRAQWAAKVGLVRSDEIVALNMGLHIGAAALDLRVALEADAVFLCTPRFAAASMIPVAFDLVRDRGVVDLVSGVQLEDGLEGEGQLNAIRRKNACGRPIIPQAIEIVRASGRTVLATGHRGSSPAHFDMALDVLAKWPEHYSRLVTHLVSLEELPKILEAVINDEMRELQGKHIGKIHIDLTRDPPSTDWKAWP